MFFKTFFSKFNECVVIDDIVSQDSPDYYKVYSSLVKKDVERFSLWGFNYFTRL